MATKFGRSGSEGTWGAAIKGLTQGILTRKQLEEMAADRAIKKQTADLAGREGKIKEADLALKIAQAQQGSFITDAFGRTQMIPGLSGISFDPMNLTFSQGPDFKPGAKPGSGKTTPNPPKPEETPAQKQAREALQNIQAQQIKKGAVDLSSAASAKAYGDLLGWDVQVSPILPEQPGAVGKFFGAKEKQPQWATITVIPKSNTISPLPKVGSSGALPSQATQTKTIRVKLKSSGQTGTIPANEFDPNLYERL